MALNLKQQAFVNAYLKSFNATKAALEAGYSEATSYSIGHNLLKKVEIANAIRAHMEQDAMSASEVLYHLAQIARGDFSELVDDKGNPDIQKAERLGKSNLIRRVKQKSITTSDKDGEGSDIFEAEVEGYDRLKALELLAKYHDLINRSTVKIEDWQSQAIDDIKAGRIDYDALVKAFDIDLATDLFRKAGVSISSE